MNKGTQGSKPIQPAMPLPHLTAAGLFISHTGSFGAQRVAECSEEYAAAEIARRTNAYPRLLAERAELVAALRETVNTLWAMGANVLDQSYPSAEDVSKALVPTSLADVFNDSRALLRKMGAE